MPPRSATGSYQPMIDNVKPLVSSCPLCRSFWKAGKESYTFEEIFRWWSEKGHDFSEKVLSRYPLAERTELQTCPKCSFGQFDPPLVGTDEFYQELAGPDRADYYNRENWEMGQAYSDLEGCHQILEVGCGPGFFLENLKSQGKEVVGLEVNPKAVEFACSRGLLVARQRLEEYAPSNPGSVDAVCLFQVLEHVANPLDFLGHCLTCLKPNGLLIVGVPNMAGYLKDMGPMVTNMPPHHVTRWTDRALLQLATRIGLDLVSLKYEPINPRLKSYFHHRLKQWGVPEYLYARKPGYWMIAILIGFLCRFKVNGLKSLPGHTVYAVFRKRQERRTPKDRNSEKFEEPAKKGESPRNLS